MALAFAGMLAMGLAMTGEGMPQALKFRVYQWHKSLGVLLLLAFFLRLALRVGARRPPLPNTLSAREKTAASITHLVMYACMLALPLSGWVMVSSSPYGLPTLVFGWFTWPHLPGVAAKEALEDAAESAHALLAYAFMGLIGLHVAAVLKHWLVDKENLLPRMGIGRVQKEGE
jgi:cytochrome b561